MRISDWSSDVGSSDLVAVQGGQTPAFDVKTADVDVGTKTDSIDEIGRASCRDRVCQCVSISVVAVSLKKKAEQIQEQQNKPKKWTSIQSPQKCFNNWNTIYRTIR